MTPPSESPPDNETITRTSHLDTTIRRHVPPGDPMHQRAPSHYYLVAAGLPPCRPTRRAPPCHACHSSPAG
eukprot:202104-Rhodomonas_salina.1